MTPEQRRTILQQIADYYGLKRNTTMAEFFGVTPQANFQRMQKGILDYEAIYEKCPDISPDWLLSGEGPMLRSERNEIIGSMNNNSGSGTQSVSVTSDKNTEAALAALAKEQEALALAQKQIGCLIDLLGEAKGLSAK